MWFFFFISFNLQIKNQKIKVISSGWDHSVCINDNKGQWGLENESDIIHHSQSKLRKIYWMIKI